MSRLPIRLRVTVAFAGVMAVVLVAIGIAVHTRFEHQLDTAINQGLRSRADDVGAALGDRGLDLADGAGRLVEPGESFVQVIDPAGAVRAAAPASQTRPLLSPAQQRRVTDGSLVVDRESPFERGEPVRLLATRVQSRGGRQVLVVGTAIDDRDDALGNLALLLVLGGAAALVLASLAGFGVATAALRPVEQMRRGAAAIGADAHGERLPVGRAADELGRLGATLNEMLARLEDSFRRERGFVADAGHELRTPLAILKTELELALRAGRTPAELRDALGSAAEETDRLAQLAEALLVIAQADRRDGLALAPAEVGAGELLDGVRRRFAARAGDAGREIVVDADEGAHLHADRRRVEQALDNLVDNALTHGAGTVQISARAFDGRVELHVRDDGPGFPEAFLARAFDRFTRADAARARGGSGLGLAIVQSVAQAHGGRARAANAAGGGADVWIELPHG